MRLSRIMLTSEISMLKNRRRLVNPTARTVHHPRFRPAQGSSGGWERARPPDWVRSISSRWDFQEN